MSLWGFSVQNKPGKIELEAYQIVLRCSTKMKMGAYGLGSESPREVMARVMVAELQRWRRCSSRHVQVFGSQPAASQPPVQTGLSPSGSLVLSLCRAC